MEDKGIASGFSGSQGDPQCPHSQGMFVSAPASTSNFTVSAWPLLAADFNCLASGVDFAHHGGLIFPIFRIQIDRLHFREQPHDCRMPILSSSW
jgi:hypothetical protein